MVCQRFSMHFRSSASQKRTDLAASQLKVKAIESGRRWDSRHNFSRRQVRHCNEISPEQSPNPLCGVSVNGSIFLFGAFSSALAVLLGSHLGMYESCLGSYLVRLRICSVPSSGAECYLWSGELANESRRDKGVFKMEFKTRTHNHRDRRGRYD